MNKLLELAEKFEKLAQDSRHWTEWQKEMPPSPAQPGQAPNLREYEPGDFDKLKTLSKEHQELDRQLAEYTNKIKGRKRQIFQEWTQLVKRNRLSDAELKQVLSS